MISSFEDIEYCISLQFLHARNNKISRCDGFTEEMQSLEYINLRLVCIYHSICEELFIISFIFQKGVISLMFSMKLES